MGQPRFEIARVSELLQAQLLQPININPAQPSLPITDLNIITGAGPANAAFSEFTPLFERNGAQVTASGIVGNNETWGDEVVASGLWNRYSLSAGQLHSTGDGFRKNNDLENDLYNIYTQVAIAPQASIQAEYRHRETKNGDLALNFDPDDFSETDRREFTQDTGRLGFRLSPSPQSDVIASAIYTRATEKQPSSDFFARARDEGYQLEGQYIHRWDHLNTVAGLGRYDVEAKQREVIPSFEIDDQFSFSRKQENIYGYLTAIFPQRVEWTFGLSYDSYHEGPIDVNKPNPKIGLQWDITDALRLRAAAFQTVKRALVVNQTIEPTQIAGFNQLFDDANGTKASRYGVALDASLSTTLYVGAEVSRRELDFPIAFDDDSITEDREENLGRAYIYWAPHPDWSLTSEYRFEEFRNNDPIDPDIPSNIKTMAMPSTVRYFSKQGLFAQFGATFVHQDVTRGPMSTLADGSDDFWILDAAVGYRLPKRFGLISIEVDNLLNQHFRFQDDNFQNSEVRNPAFIPDRIVLGRMTLTF